MKGKHMTRQAETGLLDEWRSLDEKAMMYSSFEEMPDSVLDAFAEACHANINADILLEQEMSEWRRSTRDERAVRWNTKFRRKVLDDWMARNSTEAQK